MAGLLDHKMSFGFSIGDVLSVTQLAWRCFRNAKEACGEHDELTREAGSLHSVLHQLQLEIAQPDSLINRPDDDRKEELMRLIAGCDEVLSQVDGILNRYDALQAKRPKYGIKTWQRIKFGNHEMQDLDRMRQKMAHHTQAIMFFCTLVGMGSQGRMEKFMRGELLELRLGINGVLAQKKTQNSTNESSILTKYEEDDRTVWKELRRDLIQNGYDSSFIGKHMGHIKAYVQELGDRGALDTEDLGEIHHQSGNTLEGPVRWQLAQDIWLRSEASFIAVYNQPNEPFPSARFLTELSRISKMHGLYTEVLESQKLIGERQTSSNVTKPDSSQSSSAVNGSQRTKPSSLASGRSLRQNHKGLIMREDVDVKTPQLIISREILGDTNSQIGIQANSASWSPDTITPAKHTAGLPTLTTVYPKRLSHDDKSSIRYMTKTNDGVTSLIKNPTASLSFQSFQDSGRELRPQTGLGTGIPTCQKPYEAATS